MAETVTEGLLGVRLEAAGVLDQEAVIDGNPTSSRSPDARRRGPSLFAPAL